MALAMDCATLNGFLDRVFPQISDQVRVESVDAQVLIARLLVDEQHLRPGGTVSGPAMFALADVTIYLAILSRIGEVALAVEMGAEAGDIGHTIHPHPTLSETVAMAAEVYEGTITDLYIPKKK